MYPGNNTGGRLPPPKNQTKSPGKLGPDSWSAARHLRGVSGQPVVRSAPPVRCIRATTPAVDYLHRKTKQRDPVNWAPASGDVARYLRGVSGQLVVAAVVVFFVVAALGFEFFVADRDRSFLRIWRRFQRDFSWPSEKIAFA